MCLDGAGSSRKCYLVRITDVHQELCTTVLLEVMAIHKRSPHRDKE